MTMKLALPCPRCGSGLTPRVFGSVTIDECDSCGGHWYDAGELARIRELSPAERPHDRPGVAPRWVDSKHDAMQCPRCRKGLQNERYAYSSDLVLDRCPTCNGMWVDSGELDRMDALIDEWSADHGDAEQWAAKRAEVERLLGCKLTRASGRFGAVVGYLLRKLHFR